MARRARPVLAAMGPPVFDRMRSEPLFRQVYQALRAAILEGRLKAGTRLPPTRDLAQEWGLSRNTVMTAYDLLLAEGYVEGRVGAGTYVCPALPDVPVAASTIPAAERRGAGLSRRGAELAAREPWRRTVEGRPFALGHPALDAFPFVLWGQLLARPWRTGGAGLAMEGDPLGFRPLREAVAEYLRAVRAVRCSWEQVVIVSSSQQALDLVARLLLDPGDAVWMEEPGWRGIRAALRAAGARLVPVPVDGEGLDVSIGEQTAPEARAAVVTPSHQFPLGMTMSLARRLRLLDWAARADAWIVEDDYDSEFRYAGPPLAALQGLDTAGRVIYVGSFSKVMFPALRLGYLVVPPDLVDAVTAARSFLDGGSTVVTQAALACFMAEGHFAGHLRRMRSLYGERRAALLDSLERHLAGTLAPEPGDAGLHLVARLAGGLSDKAVVARAGRRDVLASALSDHYQEETEASGLILGFAAHPAEALDAAVKRLVPACRATLPDPAPPASSRRWPSG